MGLETRNSAVRTNVQIDRELKTEQEGDELLAAALAATLVEYRNYIRQCEGADVKDAGSPGWRMVACWERLQRST